MGGHQSDSDMDVSISFGNWFGEWFWERFGKGLGVKIQGMVH